MSESSIGRWLSIAAGVVVLATIIAAIATMGSPSTQRDIRMDERRIGDLERIVRAIERYDERHQGLPPDLATLASEPGQNLAIADPVDGVRYGYEVVGDDRYRLCAQFETDTGKLPGNGRPRVDEDWLHGRGRQCFDRKIEDASKDG